VEPEATPSPRHQTGVRRAHHQLLHDTVIARARDPEGYRLVRRAAALLMGWHERHTGWALYMGEQTVRLLRRPSAVPHGTWDPWRSVTFQSPRDYACLIWILWYARSPLVLGSGVYRQFLLSRLAGSLVEQSARHSQDDVLPLNFVRSRSDRGSLVRALRALEELGALRMVDGSPDAWVSAEEEADSLFEFTEVVTALIVALDSAHLAALAAVGEVSRTLERPPLTSGQSATPSAQDDALRRAWRALLLGPVLLRRDDPAAFTAVRRAHEVVDDEAQQTFGFNLELTPTYARLVRQSGSGHEGAPGLLNPQRRGLDQAALVLCAAVRDAVAGGQAPAPDGDGCLALSWQETLAVFTSVCTAYQDAWGKEIAQETDYDALLRRVCGVLHQAGLARGPDVAGTILFLPTAACYAISYTESPQRATRTDMTSAATQPLAIQEALPW